MADKSINITKLFELGQIGRLKLKNRIVRTAAGTDYLDAEYMPVLEKQLPFYEALAKGGVGLIIIGAAVVDYPLGIVIQGQVRMDDDKFVPGWAKVTDVIHQHGTPVFMQFMHAGAWHGIFQDGIQPVSSSALSREELEMLGTYFGMTTRELSIIEIKEIIKKFGDAAERAQRAGFDGVEISIATCHLGNSFISRAWNKRHDEYGCDTIENRSRFAVEVVQEIKNRLGREFVTGVLINGAEFGIKNGTTLEEAREVAHILEKNGVDYFHVRGFGYNGYFDLHVPDSIFFPAPPKPIDRLLDAERYGRGLVVPLAAGIKKQVSVPVIAVGRLDPLLGEQILREGKADFIAMQRRLIADPELPNKAKTGRLDDIAPCTACLGCFAFMENRQPVRCRINAAVGSTEDYTLKPAAVKKKVMVIGGGPAGMEAARVAAIRGHKVWLIEKETVLGGMMHMAQILKDPRLEDLASIIIYLKKQLKKLGVNILVGKKFHLAMLEKYKPDVVVVATGGRPVRPDIEGIRSECVITMPEFHHMLKTYLRYFTPGFLRFFSRIWMPVGEKVVIMGGGLHGCELAEFLVKRGRRVTIVDEADSLRVKSWATVQNARLFEWFEKKGVRQFTQVSYERITESGLYIVTREGERIFLEADTIIPVTPLEPDTRIIDSLKDRITEVYYAGDCSQPGLIIDAIAAGYNVAKSI